MTLDEALKTGDACTRCHVGIHRASYNTVIAPAQCYECRQIDDTEELDHARLLRCPKCRTTWNVAEEDGYDLYQEGEHPVSCPKCEHEFRIMTEVSHNFTSPAIEAEDTKGAGGA